MDQCVRKSQNKIGNQNKNCSSVQKRFVKIFSGRCDFIATTGKIRQVGALVKNFRSVRWNRTDRKKIVSVRPSVFFPVGAMKSQRPEKSKQTKQMALPVKTSYLKPGIFCSKVEAVSASIRGQIWSKMAINWATDNGGEWTASTNFQTWIAFYLPQAFRCSIPWAVKLVITVSSVTVTGGWTWTMIVLVFALPGAGLRAAGVFAIVGSFVTEAEFWQSFGQIMIFSLRGEWLG